MDGGAWWITVHGVAKSRTRLRDFNVNVNVNVLFVAAWCVFVCVCVSHSMVSGSSKPHGLYSPPGSSVHGIFQARILEGTALPF